MLRGFAPILSTLSAMGARAASVFPLAAGETPTAFFPCMRGGIKADCTGVNLPKPPKKGPWVFLSNFLIPSLFTEDCLYVRMGIESEEIKEFHHGLDEYAR